MTRQFYGGNARMCPIFQRESESGRQFHGGDLEPAQKEFGHDLSEWLDLSTGINPIPYPLPSLEAELWQRLPSSSAESDLLTAAGTYYGLPEDADICACPGTQAAIQLLPRLIPQTEVAILTPTYNEHAACWRRAGHRVQEVTEISHISAETTIVILVHPNNPDGRTYEKQLLLELAEIMEARNGWLIVDEAFADIMPDISLMPDLPGSRMLILKSFGKFFGLAGLRLGFLAGPPDFIRSIRQELGPWALSGVALEIGTQALSDVEWIAKARDQLTKAAARLSAMLTDTDLKIIGGTDLFCLTESPEAPSLFRYLCKDAILVRRFPDRPERLRFGLPGAEAGWVRLETSLKRWANR